VRPPPFFGMETVVRLIVIAASVCCWVAQGLAAERTFGEWRVTSDLDRFSGRTTVVASVLADKMTLLVLRCFDQAPSIGIIDHADPAGFSAGQVATLNLRADGAPPFEVRAKALSNLLLEFQLSDDEAAQLMKTIAKSNEVTVRVPSAAGNIERQFKVTGAHDAVATVFDACNLTL
jgi:hypothetical protein